MNTTEFDIFQYRDAVFASDLDSTTRAVAFALTKWADSVGYLNPHQKTIIEFAGVSLSTLRRCLRELESAGLQLPDRQRRAEVECRQTKPPSRLRKAVIPHCWMDEED